MKQQRSKIFRIGMLLMMIGLLGSHFATNLLPVWLTGTVLIIASAALIYDLIKERKDINQNQK